MIASNGLPCIEEASLILVIYLPLAIVQAAVVRIKKKKKKKITS